MVSIHEVETSICLLPLCFLAINGFLLMDLFTDQDVEYAKKTAAEVEDNEPEYEKVTPTQSLLRKVAVEYDDLIEEIREINETDNIYSHYMNLKHGRVKNPVEGELSREEIACVLLQAIKRDQFSPNA